MVHLLTPAPLESQHVPCSPAAPRGGEGREGREQPPARPLLCTSSSAWFTDLFPLYTRSFSRTKLKPASPWKAIKKPTHIQNDYRVIFYSVSPLKQQMKYPAPGITAVLSLLRHSPWKATYLLFSGFSETVFFIYIPEAIICRKDFILLLGNGKSIFNKEWVFGGY